MKENYEDIIHLPHHVSKKRNRMSSVERAAQFSPFAALTGFDAAIQECCRLTDRPVELEEDEKNLINVQLERLFRYERPHPVVTVNYFVPDCRKNGGKFITVTGSVQRLDSFFQCVFLTDGTAIAFDRIRWIQSPIAEERETYFAEENDSL